MRLDFYFGALLVGPLTLCALLPGSLWFLILPAVIAVLHLPLVLVLFVYVRLRRPSVPTVAFFHPYCNAGGGGERVLWTAIKALQNKYENVDCVVYTGDTDASPEQIVSAVHKRFALTLPRPVTFVYLNQRSWVEAKHYPFLTMLLQSLGSVIMGWEALLQLNPHVLVDSMGYAFVLPLFRVLGGCHVVSYVHYPTISSDMLQLVASGKSSYNNTATLPLARRLKLVYYRAFSWLYGVVGACNHDVMVNSTWTKGHIQYMWGRDATVVYPPCDVSQLLQLSDSSADRKPWLLSVAQFRPEKDHQLQLNAFAQFLKQSTDRSEQYRLVLVGSCRGAEDQARVETLKQLATELNIHKQVDFRIGVSFDELKDCFSQSSVGLHSMWNEHFGIGVVEMMAAGLVTIAHDSGGPRLDIVVPSASGQPTGFRASCVDAYASAMTQAFSLTSDERHDVIQAARVHVKKFDEIHFSQGFLDSLKPILTSVFD